VKAVSSSRITHHGKSMPYDTLIDALLEEGRTKSEAILRNARAEAARLLEEVEQESDNVGRRTDTQISHDITARRTAILSRAALSGRHILLQAKQEVLDAVWRHAGRKAMTLTGQARRKVLGALLDEVLAASSPQSPRVLIDGRERPYLEEALKERGIPFEEQHQDDLLLGMKLEANGEVITNSFAARLVKAKPELMIELNRLLFTERNV
jgi:vacuolar-type H+-ATPase subunit E/Vma4